MRMCGTTTIFFSLDNNEIYYVLNNDPNAVYKLIKTSRHIDPVIKRFQV